jgi:hypothetical protein
MHTREGEGWRGLKGGISCTPSKDFKKLDHTNATKHENRGALPRFSHNPKCPNQKNLKMAVYLRMTSIFNTILVCKINIIKHYSVVPKPIWDLSVSVSVSVSVSIHRRSTQSFQRYSVNCILQFIHSYCRAWNRLIDAH